MTLLRKVYTRSVNILFKKPEFERLERLAEEKGVNRSSAVRTAVNAYCAMVLDGEPLCATGQRCFVPTYHSPPAPPASQTVPFVAPPPAHGPVNTGPTTTQNREG